MIIVLIASSGAAWESRALAVLNDDAGVVVLKRCVDVADLLAAASTGQADVAVVGTDLPGLDHAVVADLRSHGVRVVAVAAEPELTRPRAHGIGIRTVVPAEEIGELGTVVSTRDESVDDTRPAAPATITGDLPLGPPPPPPGSAVGRVITVWGPAGAPGRTMLAGGVAAELARRGLSTLLVDADPYGGAVAQQLGILDEVSGLLSAARLSAAGTMAQRFVTVQRRLSDRLNVITGIPRPDRWLEVRPGTISEIADCGQVTGNVVLDTGFSVEAEIAGDLGRPERNAITREAIEVADELLVVGAADPVGLARLARALTEVHELAPTGTVRVVVNRMRSSLGWREADVAAMPGGFGAVAGIHFLPDDQAAVDKALVAGRLLVESGESSLTRAISGLVDAMAGVPGTTQPVRR